MREGFFQLELASDVCETHNSVYTLNTTVYIAASLLHKAAQTYISVETVVTLRQTDLLSFSRSVRLDGSYTSRQTCSHILASCYCTPCTAIIESTESQRERNTPAILI